MQSWTKEEDKTIMDFCGSMNDTELAELLLNRDARAVKRRRLRLGLKNVRSPKSSMKRWTEEENIFIIESYGKMSYGEMAKYLLGRTRDAIEIHKKYINDRLKNPQNRKSSGRIWTADEDDYIKKNYIDTPYKKMAEHLVGRTSTAIQTRARLLDFKREISQARSLRSKKYEINKQFFSEPNVVNSYYAGFIAADGSLDARVNRIAIRIHPKDEHILERLVGDCGYNGDLKYYNGNSYSPNSKYVDFRIFEYEWVQDLRINFNITPRKTFTLEPPENLNAENTIAFIRGFVDGDGFVSYQPKTKDKQCFCWAVGACGTKAMMEYLKFWFDNWVPDKRRKVSAQVGGPYGKSKIFKYQVSGERALLVLSKLLSVDTPYLTRKWDPIISYLRSNPLP